MRLLRAVAAVAAILPALAAEDWLAIGPGAALRRSGPVATLEYRIAPGQISMAALPLPERGVAGMAHLRFRIRTDVATSVGVTLSEKRPGGDYSTVFWSPANQWQQIDLIPGDFLLNDGPRDPRDPDGRLDLEQVQRVAVFDLGQLFNQIAETKAPIRIATLAGEHKLDLQGLEIAAGPAGAEPRGALDDFSRDFLRWFTFGADALALSKSGNPLGKPALEFRYRQDPFLLSPVLHAVGQADLRGATKLTFEIASARDAHLLVALELQKTDGRPAPRYHLDFTVEAGQNGRMSMPFRQFTLAENSPPDPAGRLDVARVRTISLVDVTGFLDGSTDDNTIWLADMRTQ